MKFRVLGALTVDQDGSTPPLGGPKQRAVLAMLIAVAGRPVAMDRIVDGVWGVTHRLLQCALPSIRMSRTCGRSSVAE